MSTESTEALIERVLAEHEWDYPDSFCKCDAWVSLDNPWPTHVAAAITQALAEADRCGGCRDQGAHRRHCPKRPDYHPLRRFADAADGIGDSVGVPELANRAWSLAGAIRGRIEERDTTWAEDAAASRRALYDPDSGRLDNWSER